MKEKEAYKGIFKSTFLFAGVQVSNIIVKVVLNKTVAFFLGTEGVGLLGLFQSVINLLKTALGLGISQSAVRDISESKQKNDIARLQLTTSVTKKIVRGTAIIGAIIVILFSKFLSFWTFGSYDYTVAFIGVSVVIFFNIISEGYLSILKGVRDLRGLAKASLFGSLIGVVLTVPLYYLYRIDAIIPSLILSALSSVFFAGVYLKKNNIKNIHSSFSLCITEGREMVKMGLALMYVSFLSFGADYIIRAYIAKESTIDMVGLFQAGATIVTGYFGIIITAMSTDYYPRISAINKDNKKLTTEVNKQSEVGLLLVGPLIVLFVFLMDFFISFLYSKEFLMSIDYINFAIFGVLITICSNAMGMILLAKQRSNVFIYSVSFSRLIIVLLNIYFFKYFGLKGLGISIFITSLMHLLLMKAIMFKLYNIVFYKRTMKMLFITLVFCLIAFIIKNIDFLFVRYLLGSCIFIISILYSNINIKNLMGIDIVDILKKKVMKK